MAVAGGVTDCTRHGPCVLGMDLVCTEEGLSGRNHSHQLHFTDEKTKSKQTYNKNAKLRLSRRPEPTELVSGGARLIITGGLTVESTSQVLALNQLRVIFFFGRQLSAVVREVCGDAGQGLILPLTPMSPATEVDEL